MGELRRMVAFLVGGALLAGCATSDHMYLVDREVRCAFDDPMEFLAEPPGRPHVEIALLEASGAVFVPTTWETLRLYLCREARAVDADAVFGLEQHHISYSIGFTPLKLDWTNKKLMAVAVRYLEPGQLPEDVEIPALDEDGKPVTEPEGVETDTQATADPPPAEPPSTARAPR